MNKIIDRVISDWIKNWKKKILSEEDLELIELANQDLYNGPPDVEDYPGFTSACRQIKDMLDFLPSCIWVDEESEDVVTDLPSDEDNWYRIEYLYLCKKVVDSKLFAYVR